MSYQIQPLEDPRWGRFLESHPHASVFHTVPWLEALRQTYGYEPIVYTTSPPREELRNGLLFCCVDSWLTGHRLVSLPFSDHCEPLLNARADLEAILSALEQNFRRKRLTYIEIRPVQPLLGPVPLFRSDHLYCFHQLELSPDLDMLFRNFHKDSIQRKIRRAERGDLIYRQGQSELLLDSFYRLLLLTRRRHQLPPQPMRWFRNLIACFGEAVKIRVAFKGEQPVAAILTLRHKDALVYKYGCSNAQFHNLGGMHLLFWRAIQEAKGEGLRVLDLGRSDCDNAGLITFKDRWGSARSILTYSRFTASIRSKWNFGPAGESWKLRIAKQVFSHLPDGILHSTGSLIYKHIG